MGTMEQAFEEACAKERPISLASVERVVEAFSMAGDPNANETPDRCEGADSCFRPVIAVVTGLTRKNVPMFAPKRMCSSCLARTKSSAAEGGWSIQYSEVGRREPMTSELRKARALAALLALTADERGEVLAMLVDEVTR